MLTVCYLCYLCYLAIPRPPPWGWIIGSVRVMKRLQTGEWIKAVHMPYLCTVTLQRRVNACGAEIWSCHGEARSGGERTLWPSRGVWRRRGFALFFPNMSPTQSALISVSITFCIKHHTCNRWTKKDWASINRRLETRRQRLCDRSSHHCCLLYKYLVMTGGGKYFERSKQRWCNFAPA